MIYLQAPDAKNVSTADLLRIEYNRDVSEAKPFTLALSSDPNNQKSPLVFNTYYDAEQCQVMSPSRDYDELHSL